jgi:predicted phage tail protein
METRDTTEHALQVDAIRLRGRRNGGLLIALGALAVIGSWWLVPQSIFGPLTAADPTVGAINLAVGIIAIVSGITLIVVGVQTQRRSAGDQQSPTGRANTRFDNPGAPTPNGQPPLNWTGLTPH